MASNGKTFKRLAAFVVIISFCTVAAPARAGEGDWIGLGVFIETVVAAPAAIYMGLHIYHTAIGEKPDDLHLAGSYVSGVINIGWGVGMLILIEGCEKDKTYDTWLGLAIGHMVLGVLDINFTIWAHLQPERPEQKLTLSPIIMQDIEGNPAVGIGLNLVNW